MIPNKRIIVIIAPNKKNATIVVSNGPSPKIRPPFEAEVFDNPSDKKKW
jgi:hypothetical protein